MIRYADEKWGELQFVKFYPKVERRDSQWIDVELTVDTAQNTPLPEDTIALSILVICTHQGHPLQAVVLEEGCDSEYQLTELEKEQITSFIRQEEIQQAIFAAASNAVD